MFTHTITNSSDAVGNRQRLTSTVPAIPAGLWNYDANDRFTGATADTYDANGNTISSGGIAATYDFENRLITKGGITIVYDGDGNRVRKTVAGITTRYLVDELNPTGYSQVLVETTTNNNFVRQYVYGLDLISQRRQLTSTTFEVRYFGYDGHGSTRFLADNAATVTDTFDYDAFGNLITRTGTTPTHYLYAGEQFDADLNLYYNRARYLDVRTGRFWTIDTFEGRPQEPSSLHKYLYANANPVGRKDPNGNLSMQELQATGAAIVTLATSAVISLQNVVGTVYINLYRVPAIIETANNYLTLTAFSLGLVSKVAENLRNFSGTYPPGPVPRGDQFERAAGANLAHEFPGVDHWDPETKTAFQFRSTTQTQSMDALLGVVRKGASGLNNLPDEMNGYYRTGPFVSIESNEISYRVFYLGIPAKPLSFNFGAFLARVGEIGRSERVVVVVQFVEGLEGKLAPVRRK